MTMVAEYGSAVLFYMLIVSWLLTPVLCFWTFIKIKQVKALLTELANSQIEVARATQQLCHSVAVTDENVETLWDAVFPEDPDGGDEFETEPGNNVVTIGKRAA